MALGLGEQRLGANARRGFGVEERVSGNIDGLGLRVGGLGSDEGLPLFAHVLGDLAGIDERPALAALTGLRGLAAHDRRQRGEGHDPQRATDEARRRGAATAGIGDHERECTGPAMPTQKPVRIRDLAPASGPLDKQWYRRAVPRREYEGEDEGFGEASRYTAHLDRGWALLSRGDLPRARTSAHQALQLKPQVPDAAMLMAAISLAESDPESSLEWYERAIEADADFVDAQLAAAQVLLYDLDEPHRALARAAAARELDEATLADQLDFGLIEIEALVSLDDRATAHDKLEHLAELWVIEQLLDPDSRDEVEEMLREFGLDEDDPEHEEIEQVMLRVVQLALRVARLRMDLGAPNLAQPWLEGLLRRFGDDPDIWYLYNEAAYTAGDGRRAAHAALQVLQLDARIDLPEWAPAAEVLHTKVVELLRDAPDTELRALAREPGFVVVVNEAPPFELVLEGVDPRARALALAARSARDLEAPAELTGVALYRRNLIHFARDARMFDSELAFAVHDELAAFFGFDDTRRERLGLPPTSTGASWGRDGTRLKAAVQPAPADRKDEAAGPNKSSKKTSTKKKPSKKKPAKKKPSKKKAAKKKPAKTTPSKKKPAKKKPSKKKTGQKQPAKKKAGKKKPASKPKEPS